LLDRSKRMLDDLAAPVDKIGPRRYPLFHTIKRILVLKTRDRAVIVRASRAQWTVAARPGVGVVDLPATCAAL
jgi:hypothetical protein